MEIKKLELYKGRFFGVRDEKNGDEYLDLFTTYDEALRNAYYQWSHMTDYDKRKNRRMSVFVSTTTKYPDTYDELCSSDDNFIEDKNKEKIIAEYEMRSNEKTFELTENQTPETYLEAVKQDGLALQYVKTNDKKSLFIDKNKSTYKEKTMSDLNEKVEGNSTQVLGKSDRTPVERITTDKFKQLLAADNLPFLPNENGFCNVKAVKTSAGYELQGANQLIAKTYLHERGMDNDNILTFRQAQKAKTSIRAGEKGFYLSFYDQEKGANTVTRYFAESQTSKPDLIPYQPVKAESKKEKHVQISSDAQDYITNYLKCVNENRAFTASPEVAAEFKENFAKELEKSPMQIFKMGDRAAKEIFIETDKGKEWLKTEKGQQWLNTENGKDFLKANPDKGIDKGKEVQKSVKPIERAISVER